MAQSSPENPTSNIASIGPVSGSSPVLTDDMLPFVIGGVAFAVGYVIGSRNFDLVKQFGVRLGRGFGDILVQSFVESIQHRRG